MKNYTFVFIFITAFSASLHAEDVLLSPVVVTAPTYKPETVENKSGTEIRDIPASIVIISSQILEQQGAANFDDAMRNVSGLQPSNQGGYGFSNNYKARGLGVSFLRDNIADGSAQNGYYRSFVDIQEIEVSKGPAATTPISTHCACIRR